MGRKKRSERTVIINNEAVAVKTVFRTAIYARLSKEDSGKSETDTFENQVAIIDEYVNGKGELKIVDRYYDNGYKGTSFDRPEFNRLMMDVKENKIDCIVVKDLSRFGRDYVEMGNLIEKLFPYLEVRFISISENYDSYDENQDITMPLTNIVNEWYAKDISKKVKTSVIERQKKGEFPGTHVPYGYIRATKSGCMFEIDKEAAEVVKLIFDLKLNGMSNTKITRKLNGSNVPSPAKYKYLKGTWKNEKYANTVWRYHAVKRIVNDARYIGHMVYGTIQTSLYEGKKRKRTTKDEWIIVENVNLPIIRKEIFDKVQEITEIARKKHFDNISKAKSIVSKPNILYGKLICGDCGKNMRRYRNINETSQYSYKCGGYIDSEYLDCSRHTLKYEEEVFSIVKKAIECQSKLFLEIDLILEKNKDMTLEKIKTFELNIYNQSKITRSLAVKKNDIYKNYVEGILTRDEYLTYKKSYSLKYDHENSKLEDLISRKKQYKKVFMEKDLIEKIKKINIEEPLNVKMLEMFVDKIYYYENGKYEISLNYRDEYKYMVDELGIGKVIQTCLK